MGKNVTGKAMRGIIIGLIILIAFPIALWTGYKKHLDYTENGRQVECTVIELVRGRKGKQYVTVEYIDENGSPRSAEATVNRRVSLDEEFTAYVLDDEPGKVYCPPEKWLIIVLIAVFGLLIFMGLFGVFGGIYSIRKHNLLLKRGLPARGEVISFWQTEIGTYCANVRFIDNAGEERIQEFGTENKPAVGNTVNLVYHMKKNGKCVADIIEI